MELTHQRELDASPQQVYNTFLDLTRVGQCFPGARVTKPDHEAFEGEITVVLGPVTLTYDGKGKFATKDAQHRRAVITAKGRERHGFGVADITVDLRVAPVSGNDERCLATMVTKLDVKGAPTKFGSSLAQRISDPMIERFLDCMACPECPPESELVSSIDILRTVLPDLAKSYGRSALKRFRRK